MIIFFSVALQPNSDPSRPTDEAYRSHTVRHTRNRWPSDQLVAETTTYRT